MFYDSSEIIPTCVGEHKESKSHESCRPAAAAAAAAAVAAAAGMKGWGRGGGADRRGRHHQIAGTEL